MSILLNLLNFFDLLIIVVFILLEFKEKQSSTFRIFFFSFARVWRDPTFNVQGTSTVEHYITSTVEHDMTSTVEHYITSTVEHDITSTVEHYITSTVEHYITWQWILFMRKSCEHEAKLWDHFLILVIYNNFELLL